jgi:hypothetical protein
MHQKLRFNYSKARVSYNFKCEMEKTQIPNTFYNSKAEFGLELSIYLFYKYKDNLSLTGKTKTQAG